MKSSMQCEITILIRISSVGGFEQQLVQLVFLIDVGVAHAPSSPLLCKDGKAFRESARKEFVPLKNLQVVETSCMSSKTSFHPVHHNPPMDRKHANLV
jgi:hypothetical protein